MQSLRQWADITHVVNVLGKYQGNEGICDDWKTAQKYRWKGTKYLDWPVNHPSKRNLWREVFATIADALETSSTRMLVHSVNGKDRSPFTIYAFLRLFYTLAHKDAMSIAQQRLGRDGHPLFYYENQQHQLTAWLDAVDVANIDAESVQLRWRDGTLPVPFH